MIPRTIEAFGTRVHYFEAGTGEPLVLLHGIGASAGDFTQNVPALAAHYRVLVPDLVGFAGTAPPPPPATRSIEEQVAFLFAFLDALQLDRVRLLGWSLGGAIALRALLQSPQRFGRTLLIGPAGLGAEVHPIFRLVYLPIVGELLTLPNLLTATVNYRLLYTQRRGVVSREFLRRAVEAARPPWHQQTTLGLVRHHRALYRGQRDLDVHEQLASLRTPLHIVWGRHDCILPAWHGERAVRIQPTIELTIFDDCGHMPFLEDRERFDRLAVEYLARRISPPVA